MGILEKEIESYLVSECLRLGWLCMKFTSPGRRGVPDRIVLAPGGKMFFVELKKKDGVLSSAQVREIKRYREYGQKVYVAKSKECVSDLLYHEFYS